MNCFYRQRKGSENKFAGTNTDGEAVLDPIYDVINDGVEKNGLGVWFADESHLTIIVESDTTYGTFEVEQNTLTLVISTEETDEIYGFSTILKYSRIQ